MVELDWIDGSIGLEGKQFSDAGPLCQRGKDALPANPIQPNRSGTVVVVALGGRRGHANGTSTMNMQKNKNPTKKKNKKASLFIVLIDCSLAFLFSFSFLFLIFEEYFLARFGFFSFFLSTGIIFSLCLPRAGCLILVVCIISALLNSFLCHHYSFFFFLALFINMLRT